MALFSPQTWACISHQKRQEYPLITDSTELKVPVKFNESLSTDLRESAVALPFFELRYFFFVAVFPRYTSGLNYFCFLNTASCSEASETCVHNLHAAITFHQEDLRTLKYCAEFLLTRYCPFS